MMTSKDAFVQRWKLLQALLVVFVLITLAASLFYAAALPWLWAGLLPIFAIFIFRLRCWNCGERLTRDGGAHIEWSRKGPFNWKRRHKRCGAELS